MNKGRRAKVSLFAKKKLKLNKEEYTITLIVSVIIISSVLLIVFDSIKKSNTKSFHSFYDNKYSNKYVIRGIDISHHNGTLDWAALKSEGIMFAYMKSTEGTSHKDKKYSENYISSKQADIKVGTYHFYTFGLDGIEQAQHFIRNSKVGKTDLIPAIDVEHSSINRYSKDKSYRKKVIAELMKMENEMFDYYGVRPMIYTNKDCYKLYIENNFSDNLIWMSDLLHEPHPKDCNWVIWQFSHTGNINGISGDIDLNYFRYSFRQFSQILMP